MINFPGNLHTHTEYSNLRLRDSINKIKDLIDYSLELNYEVLAITDHEATSSFPEAQEYYNKIKEKNPNFKLILGNEIYLCRNGLTAENFNKNEDKYFHFILLAKDEIGYKQINKLSSNAWMRSYFERKQRRVPTYYNDLIEIIEKNPGHLIGSSACLGGYLGTQLLKYNETKDEKLLDKIKNWCAQMVKLFGKDNFYLEMQPSANKEQEIVNKYLYQISKELNIPYIFTTDAHYLKKNDSSIHKAFLNAQDGDREVDSFYATTYIMDTEELESYMNSYFSKEDFFEGYKNILKIKNMCIDYSIFKPLEIPQLKWREPKIKEFPKHYFEDIPYLNKFWNSDFIGDKRLAELLIEKFELNPYLKTKERYNEVNNNLEMTFLSSEVNKTHWSAYFLNLQNILDVCWSAGTLIGAGRGSGVGFELLYLLDITQIDPLRETTKCFSWRFLNPARVSVLDIDVDIESGKRAVVLQALRNYYGIDRVANVATFGTEKSKSAIQTAARGLGIDVDIAQYLSALIPSDRGQTRTLKQCFYGDEEKGFKPINQFVFEMTNNYPELWEVAQKIEGLVCRMGIHAGGVIFTDKPFYEYCALMRAPSGEVITQCDLHSAEKQGLIKMDLLSVEALDKIHTCLNLLIEYNYIKEKETLKETYENVVGVYNLERENINMWKMIWNHKIESLFQMEKQSGIQGIAIAKPKSVNELSVLNSVIRLMAPDKNSKTPLEMWALYRQDINYWIKEMRDYGLTEEEILWLSHHNAITDGICESQEGLMSLVQEERLGGHDLNFADKCRKALAKKIGTLFDECEETFFKTLEEKKCSQKLGHYVWDVLLKVQRGYSFNRSHCLAYSIIALQEMNLAFKFPIIFWNCACLITDSGGAEEAEEIEIEESTEDEIKKKARTSKYDKIATALGKIIDSGVKVTLPNINKSAYTFTPDVENNQILFGLRGMPNVGEEVVKNIIEKRPYSSMLDFYYKVQPKKPAMITLIKSGAFDEFNPRQYNMAEFIWHTCDKKNKLTLQNLPTLIKFNLLTEETEEKVFARRIYEFNRYLKSECKNGDDYKLDDRAINFLAETNYLSFVINGSLKAKVWDKIYQKWMNIFRQWITENGKKILDELNYIIFKEDWDKYASGNISSWEMIALSFYYHDHELKNINKLKYGFSDYSSLPETPVIDKFLTRKGIQIPIYKISKICGTCIAKDKAKGLVYLLTTNGLATVRFNKEYFAMFDKQVSEKQIDGKKKILERSWFNKGNMIIVQGYRRDNEFVAKTYFTTPGHQLYHIDKINNNNDLIIRSERYKGVEEDDED